MSVRWRILIPSRKPVTLSLKEFHMLLPERRLQSYSNVPSESAAVFIQSMLANALTVNRELSRLAMDRSQTWLDGTLEFLLPC